MFDEEHEKTRVQIMLMVGFVHSAMVDLALSLAEGQGLHDALRSTVRGDRKLDADAAMALQAVVEASTATWSASPDIGTPPGASLRRRC